MFTFLLILPDTRPVYVAGDTVIGTVVRNIDRAETLTSLSVSFSGTITLTDQFSGKTLKRSVLFDHTIDLISEAPLTIEGTRTWPFQFTFPALRQRRSLRNGKWDVLEGFGNDDAPRPLPPVSRGEFVSKSQHRCSFAIEYTLVAKLQKQGNGMADSMITHARLNHATPMHTIAQPATIIPPTCRVEPLPVKIVNKIKPLFNWSERYRAWPAPSIRIHHDSIVYTGKPLNINLNLLDRDGDVLPTGSANVLLLDIDILIKETMSITYVDDEKPQSYSHTRKWPYKSQNLNGTFSGDGALCLCDLLEKPLDAPLSCTIDTPVLKIQHTVTLKARIRSGNRVYKYNIEHGFKVSPQAPPPNKRAVPVLMCTTPEGVVHSLPRTSAEEDTRQDSVGLPLATGYQKGKRQIRGEQGINLGLMWTDRYGVRRQDWEYTP